MDFYAVCDKDGTRLLVKRTDQPQFNQAGKCYGSDETLSVNDELEDLPDFPAPGEFKKVMRLSILPLEIEYEEPPFVARVWACCDEDGLREVRCDSKGDLVHVFNGGWGGGHYFLDSTDFPSLLEIPNWPAPGERRELRCVPTLNIEWADEPKREKPRFDDAVVERVVKTLQSECDTLFEEFPTDSQRLTQLAHDLCTLRDQMNSK